MAGAKDWPTFLAEHPELDALDAGRSPLKPGDLVSVCGVGAPYEAVVLDYQELQALPGWNLAPEGDGFYVRQLDTLRVDWVPETYLVRVLA